MTSNAPSKHAVQSNKSHTLRSERMAKIAIKVAAYMAILNVVATNTASIGFSGSSKVNKLTVKAVKPYPATMAAKKRALTKVR
ncbi:hypothetical protein ACFOEE_08700 [Pseudoalteromonas fenneropenaei]|uniref:Uncharacterized protein n=1 Tax=Pseudoalteromonas fenneropenaei TaxID=1737459 RepID=A0ABV7CJ72_9GAMM